MELSDYLAVSEAKGDGVFGGNGFLWIILIFLFFLAFNGNGGIFGSASNDLSQVERDVLTTSANTQTQILDSRYTTQLGFQELQAQMYSQCCDIKNTIHSEGEETRALIQANTIQDLRDQLNTAVTASANAVQTQNILNSLGRFVINPSTPYYYGTYYSGTTI